MKSQARNSFSGGMLTDVSTMSTPNTVLTDTINTTLITSEGNEFTLQSAVGNAIIQNLDLSAGIQDLQNVTPIAARSYGDKLYIITKAQRGASTVYGVGYYNGDVEGSAELQRFQYLSNLFNPTTQTLSSFVSPNLQLSDEVTMELQEAVEGSINIIINDAKKGIFLINDGAGKLQESNLLGTYIDDSTLSQQLSLTKNITTLGAAKFTGVIEGGNLYSGTYNFYFKYVDGLDNESDIFAHEGPVMLYVGSPLKGIESIRGGLLNENTNKGIKLELTNLDPNFDAVSVYYTRETSDFTETIVTEYKKLTNSFKFTETTKSITLIGTEQTEDSNYAQINESAQEIKSAKSITQANGFLFAAGIDNSAEDDADLRNYAKEIHLEEYAEDSIGNLDIQKSTIVASEIVEITDETNFIEVLSNAIKNNLTRGVAYVLTKSLVFTADHKNRYANFLSICTKTHPFKGILHGNGKTITLPEVETFAGALFPFCENAEIRDLKIIANDVGLNKAIFVTYNNDVFENFEPGTALLCREFNNSKLTRCEIAGSLKVPIQHVSGYIPEGYLFEKDSSIEGPVLNKNSVGIISNIANSSELTDVTVSLNIVTSVDKKYTNTGQPHFPFYRPVIGLKINALGNVKDSFINNLVINACNISQEAVVGDKPKVMAPVLEITTLLDFNTSSKISNTFIGNYSIRNNIATPIRLDISAIRDNINAGNYLSNVGALLQYTFIGLDGVTNKYNLYYKPYVTTYDVDSLSSMTSTELKKYLLNSNIKYKELTPVGDKNYYIDFIGYTPENPGLNPSNDSFEYYNPETLTNKLGYWANEYYRFGIRFVNILGKLSNVYDISGNVDNVSNSYGVYKTTDRSQLSDGVIKPIGFKPIISEETLNKLKSKGIHGYIITRQNRIPTILCQGLTIQRVRETGLPIVNGLIEAFNTTGGTSLHTGTNINGIPTSSEVIHEVGGLISPDIALNSEYYSSIFTGKKVTITLPKFNISALKASSDKEGRLIYGSPEDNVTTSSAESEAIYVPEGCFGVSLKDNVFKTVAGDSRTNYSYEYITKKTDSYQHQYIRGEFAAFLGLMPSTLLGLTFKNKLVNIENKREPNIEISIRQQDQSAYFPITQRRALDNSNPVYKGDCFVGNFYTRVSKNFLNPEAPFQDGIVTETIKYPEGAKPNSMGYGKPNDFKDVNLADLNAVRMGIWVGFKCCSNVNHIYRTLDLSRPSERALFQQGRDGNQFQGARGFYPYTPITTSPYSKLLDSTVMNSGYNRTLSRLESFNLDAKYNLKQKYPTRVSFSRKHFGSSLINNYRNFDLLAYRDYPSNMGEITKIVDLFSNLLIVFERGTALAPIQERTLMGSGDGGNLFIESPQILPERLLILSDKYGSTHPTSIVKTQSGVYGIDIEQRKVWRTNGQNFELISDFKIQKLLNTILDPLEDKDFNQATNAVRSYVHPYKNDVLFCFDFKELRDRTKETTVVFSELANVWSTRLSWTAPLAASYRNNLITFRVDRSQENTGTIKAWEHGVIKSANRLPGRFFNKQETSEIEVIVGGDTIDVQKIFTNLSLVSNNVMPSSIVYSITQGAYNPEENEVEVSTEQTPLDIRKVGRIKGTALYKENIVNITIKALDPFVSYEGWVAPSNVAILSRSARLRDKYLRLRLIYDNMTPVLLHSIITHFTKSYS